MTMLQGPVADLKLTTEMNKDAKTQQRMLALQMMLDAHSRGLPVLVPTDAAGHVVDVAPKDARKLVYEGVEKWRRYIFDGEAIG